MIQPNSCFLAKFDPFQTSVSSAQCLTIEDDDSNTDGHSSSKNSTSPPPLNPLLASIQKSLNSSNFVGSNGSTNFPPLPTLTTTEETDDIAFFIKQMQGSANKLQNDQNDQILQNKSLDNTLNNTLDSTMDDDSEPNSKKSKLSVKRACAHEVSRLYNCHLCPKGYGRKSHLQRHFRTAHANEVIENIPTLLANSQNARYGMNGMDFQRDLDYQRELKRASLEMGLDQNGHSQQQFDPNALEGKAWLVNMFMKLLNFEVDAILILSFYIFLTEYFYCPRRFSEQLDEQQKQFQSVTFVL